MKSCNPFSQKLKENSLLGGLPPLGQGYYLRLRHGGDFIFAEKSALKCVLANALTDLTVSFVPVAKQWRAIQMVNRVTSQIIQ